MILPPNLLSLLRSVPLWVFDYKATPKAEHNGDGCYRIIVEPADAPKVFEILRANGSDLALSTPYTPAHRNWREAGVEHGLDVHFGTIKTTLTHCSWRHPWFWDPVTGVRLKLNTQAEPYPDLTDKPVGLLAQLIDSVNTGQAMEPVVVYPPP